MTVKGDTLFALGNSLPKGDNNSVLLLIEISTGKLIKSYSLVDSAFTYLNDLAISKNNDIYITDSENDRIFTIQAADDNLEIFIESDEIARSNGIAISDDDKYLYLATYDNGIRIFDFAI